MFTLYDRLDERLRCSLEQLETQLQCPLIFGHFCWGLLTQPGSLRLTRMHVSSEFGGQLAELGRNGSHEEAFRNHVVQFGRSGILLDWITMWMESQISPLRLEPNRMSHTISLHFVISKQFKAGLAWLPDDSTVAVKNEFADVLVPNELASEYLQNLYQLRLHRADPRLQDQLRFLAQQLIGARYAGAKAMSNEMRSAVSTLGRAYQKVRLQGERLRTWTFLGALQTALMYVRATGREDQDDDTGFVSIGRFYSFYEPEEGKSDHLPVGIISAVFPPSEAKRKKLTESIERLLGDSPFEKAVRQIGHYEHSPETDGLSGVNRGKWDEAEVQEALSKAMERAFTIHAFPRWILSLLMWLCLVIEELRDLVHEGQPLSFVFTIGDLTGIRDSGLFEVLDFAPSTGVNSEFVPWTADGQYTGGRFDEDSIRSLLGSIRRQVGKKNYAWFQAGKYALLWDATFPSRYPSALIQITDSSWDVFLNQCRMGRPPAASRIVTATAYLQSDGAGGVIIGGRETLTFRKSQNWRLVLADAGEQKLERKIRGILESWQLDDAIRSETVDVLVGTLIAVAEDPHSGCMLALMNAGRAPNFRDMGEPWHTANGNRVVSMSRDELKALMSMDGATCLFLRNADPTLVFRRLVPAPDANVSLVPDAEESLDGEGSRKWSGALAASRADIDLVISVSQDGPIYVFEQRTGTNAPVDLLILRGENRVPAADLDRAVEQSEAEHVASE